MDPNLDAALAHISNALDDLDSSPDQRPVPLLREAMAHIRAAAAPPAAPETCHRCENTGVAHEGGRNVFCACAAGRAASTPAAPGIDTDSLRRLTDNWLAQAERERHSAPSKATAMWACAKELRDSLALIDASPKGELESWMRGTKACAEVLGQVTRQMQDSPKGGSASQQADAKRLDFLIRTYSHLRMRNGAWVVAVGGETPAPGDGYPTAHAAIDAAMANERATDFAAAGVAAGPCPVCSEAGPCACGGAP